MRFRPCIDIHDGKVKQIIGSSLNDTNATENFVSVKDADHYAGLYKSNDLSGGHIIILNKPGTEEYEASKAQALKALKAYENGMHIGGGINADNAPYMIEAGASHVIVTSYVFVDGKINEDNLKKLVGSVGRERIVLDLSCRRKGDGYYITTDRWQKMTDVSITDDTLDYMAGFADEFLIHAVDVEGKQNGMEEELIEKLASWNRIPITYAGGVRLLEDIDILYEMGQGMIDVTIGSALDLFGGKLKFSEVVAKIRALS